MIRRLAAVVAVVLALAQGAAVAASAVAYAGDAIQAVVSDCCVKGSHPPGQCPLHRKPSAACRLSCAASTAGPIVILAVGELPAPARLVAPEARVAAAAPLFESALDRAPAHPTPPPKA